MNFQSFDFIVFFFYSSMLCFLLLIYLVSYQNNFIYFQEHCGFNIWSLLFSLPCFKRKGKIFRFPVVKRSLLGISFSISFLRIPYSLKFCTVLHFYLLCFHVLCLLYVCNRKLILNPLISLFLFYLDLVLSIPHFFSFVPASFDFLSMILCLKS